MADPADEYDHARDDAWSEALSESDHHPGLAADHSVERMREHAHTLEDLRRVNCQRTRASEREQEIFEVRKVELEQSAEKVQRFEGREILQADCHDASQRVRERRQREREMEREEREREKKGVRMLEEAIREGERAAEEDEDWIERQSDLIGEKYARSMYSGDSKDDEVERLPKPRRFPIGVHPEARDYYGIEQEGEIWKDDGDKEMQEEELLPTPLEVWERRDDMASDATGLGFTLDEGDTLTHKGIYVYVCMCMGFKYMYTCVCVHWSTYMYTCVHNVCMCMGFKYMYTCVRVHWSTYMYTCVHIHIHINATHHVHT